LISIGCIASRRYFPSSPTPMLHAQLHSVILEQSSPEENRSDVKGTNHEPPQQIAKRIQDLEDKFGIGKAESPLKEDGKRTFRGRMSMFNNESQDELEQLQFLLELNKSELLAFLLLAPPSQSQLHNNLCCFFVVFFFLFSDLPGGNWDFRSHSPTMPRSKLKRWSLRLTRSERPGLMT